jgi:hypothetical protein
MRSNSFSQKAGYFLLILAIIGPLATVALQLVSASHAAGGNTDGQFFGMLFVFPFFFLLALIGSRLAGANDPTARAQKSSLLNILFAVSAIIAVSPLIFFGVVVALSLIFS